MKKKQKIHASWIKEEEWARDMINMIKRVDLLQERGLIEYDKFYKPVASQDIDIAEEIANKLIPIRPKIKAWMKEVYQ